jgi:hypothetical protein
MCDLMAGEKKGEAFECIVFLALQELGYENGKTLFWGEKPKGFSIDPDFILGQLDNPTHWILATSSGSAKNSLEKFWRNVGEMFEAKRVFVDPPKVINLVLETNLRDALRLAMSSLADSELLLEKSEYGKKLQSFIDRLLPRIPSSKQERINYFKFALNSSHEIQPYYQYFKKELKEILTKSKPEFNSLWYKIRTEERLLNYRESRNTYVRRGTAKIMILPQEMRLPLYKSILYGNQLEKLPDYFYNLGYASKTLTGFVVSDPEIIWVVKHLAIEDIEYILNKSYSARPKNWENWINILRATRIDEHQKYIEEHYKELVTSNGMFQYLLNHSPQKEYKWLFTHLMELFKLASGKRQGYGYSVLSRDVGYTTGISQGYLELSDWVNGFIEAPKAINLIPDIAKALAHRLEKIPLAQIKDMGLKIEGEYYRNLMETKIISYWLFEPLPLLIQKTLLKFGKSVQNIKKHPTFIGEYLMKATSIASPHVMRSGNTLIGWRSAYDLGKHHKTKELSGRGQALRYEFNNGVFQKRQDIKKMILVLDGTFTNNQIKALLDSGWDSIFYADEMDHFIEAII